MLTVETKWHQITDKESQRTLIVNGIQDVESSGDIVEGRNARFDNYNSKALSILTSYSFIEVAKFFSVISYVSNVEWWENSIEVEIIVDKVFYYEKFPCIKINLQIIEWEHWAKPWSISSVARQFETNLKELENEKIRYWQEDEDSILNGFGLEYFPDNNSLVIDKEVATLFNILEKIVDKTNKNLLASLDSEAVLTYFQFPQEIKTACKQYLVYFTQFIADLGSAIDTELKEELNHTLFKITPKDKNESLDRIREALTIYLNAPNDPSFQFQVSSVSDIAVKQWEANFYHLKSQLSLATSIIQAKESTIETLQLSNYQYRQLLESHNAKKESEKEDIIKGIVTVKKYEGKGFSIDFAEILRRLKRTK